MINYENKERNSKRIINPNDNTFVNSLERKVLEGQIKEHHLKITLKTKEFVLQKLSKKLSSIKQLEENKTYLINKSNQLMDQFNSLKSNRDKTVTVLMKEIEKKVNTNCKEFLIKANKKTQKKIDEIVHLQSWVHFY
jgi:flagellar biosynthesis chaperone FliJ